jgi:hypothetical protein
MTALLIPTTSSPTLEALDYSLCAVRRAGIATDNIGRNATTYEVIWKPGGFRWMALANGLASKTNYTAWFVDEDQGEGDGGRLSGPIMFMTKPGQFKKANSIRLTVDRWLPMPFCPFTRHMPRYLVYRTT